MGSLSNRRLEITGGERSREPFEGSEIKEKSDRSLLDYNRRTGQTYKADSG